MLGTLTTEGTRTLGIAKMLAAELETSPRPATRILQDYSRQPLRLDITGPPGSRRLADDEKHRLGAPGLAQCCHRDGFLRYGTHGIAAAVTLMWLPARLPAEACWELAHTNRPAGLILERHGLARADRRALVLTEHDTELGTGDDGLDIAIRSSAVLIVGDWPAAIAVERVPRAFLASLP